MTVIRAADGNLVPLDVNLPAAGGGWTAPRSWAQLMDDYAAIWKTQPQVRKVVSFLARNIAQLNLTLYRRLEATDRQRVEDHPLARAIRHPLGWDAAQKMSKTLWIETLVSDRAIYDNAYLLKLHEGGELRLLPWPPAMIEPLGSDWLAPAGYELRGPHGTRTVQARDVVHFRGYNASDRRAGLSPIESLRQILLEDLASDRYREQLWNRGARISGVIERPADAPRWSDQARQRFQQDWRSTWAGEGPEAGGTPILEEGMTWRPTTFSARDAQWLEAKKLTREEVAAAYHVPQPMVGILDRATFSNVRDLHESVYQDTLPPWCVGIEEDIEQQLIPDFDDLVQSNAYVEFDLLEKLKGRFEDQARAMQTAVGAPWLTRSEARARFNLPRIDDPALDRLIVPLNVIAGGQASPTDTAPPLAARQAVSRLLERCARSTVGRWHEVREGRRDPGTVWQPDRWGRELLADLEGAGLDGAQVLAAQVLELTRAAVTDALEAPDPEQTLARKFREVEDDVDKLISELTEEAAA